MSLADEAYQAALAEIERVQAAGETALDLSGEAFHALERVPTEIAGLEGLTHLDLDNTKVTDLIPLSPLVALQKLWLNNTPVTDLTPLTPLSALQSLWLNRTPVTDLTPLTPLTALQTLGLNDNPVTDLTPLAPLIALRTLWLNGTKVTDLTPLSPLTALQLLWLDRAKVTDLTPLSPLTALQSLWLDRTKVTDLTPLSPLTTLQALHLDGTPVTDLTPLAPLTALHSLYLDNTKVTDLRPIRDLPRLGAEPHSGLDFAGTPFANATDETRRLAAIGDSQQRTRETLAFLKTLPPPPAPLPWEVVEGPDQETEPEVGPAIPPGVPAPLQVVEIDGMLRPATPGDGLDDAGSLLARQAWEALRDFLTDLAELRPRIDNQLPQMGRALVRFDTALGADFSAVNPIALGLHGRRVIRLAGGADETLASADAEELRELAAAIDLFLERFPDWRAYRAGAEVGMPEPETVAAHLPEIDDIADALFDRAEIDIGVPESLKAQVATMRDDPADHVAARGLVDSLGNVLSALALPVWRAARAVARATGRQAVGMVRLTVDEAKKAIAKGLALAGLDLILNKAQVLRALATAMPEKFGWLLAILSRFGL